MESVRSINVIKSFLTITNNQENQSIPFLPKTPIFPMEQQLYSPPVDITELIRQSIHVEEVMNTPEFIFDISKEAVIFNSNLLKQNNFELEQLLNPKSKCVTNYES